MQEDSVKRFYSLFRGNGRSHGMYDPKVPGDDSRGGRAETVKAPPELDQYRAHLEGAIGLGVVPVLDDATAWFGCLDIDAHADRPDIDLVALEARVKELDLPLVLCRSKSGGAHLYLFGSEPLPAASMRATLAKWAADLGHAGCEVFPKQSKLLTDPDGSQQIGNWINLCYFGADNTIRYAVEGSKKITFEHFLDVAENKRITATVMMEKAESAHAEAPPCIQKMISSGVGRGHRNEALYNFVVYVKQAFPETWRDKAFDLNAKVFTQPLTHSEAKKTIQSAGRRDYRYKCKEEPCRSRCNSSLCVQRKFGITPEEKGELEMGETPDFTHLVKYITEPVRWGLYVSNKQLILGTAEIMDYRKVREAVAEHLTLLIPPMKNDRWQAILHQLMQSARHIEAPEEASASGMIRYRLMEFCERADLTSAGTDTNERENLLHGSPVVQERTGGRCVMFRASDFVDFLKKTRSEELRGPNLWMALRDLGIEHTRLRVSGTVVPVWVVPLDEENIITMRQPTITSEI